MANFVFISSENALERYSDFRIARIDGSKATTMKAFYEAIARELAFPDYFGHNLDSLDELLNDFEWLQEDKIALYIYNADAFLSQEKSDEKKADLLNLLDVTAEDWKWVDDEVEETSPKQFLVLFDPSERLRTLLDKEGFAYEKPE